MDVLVTGATGHLGNVLVRELLERGHSVRVLVRSRSANSPALAGLDVERVEGDLFDREAVARAVDGSEWVFHSAALISTLERDAAKVERVNHLGTRAMIEAALDAEVERFVYVSSVEAMDLHPSEETNSEIRFDPESCMMSYGRSKALATLDVLAAVRERGLPAVVGVPSGLVGPFDFGSSRTAAIVRRFLKRQIPAYVEGGFDFVDVRDVASGLIAAAERGRLGESYLLTGQLLSYYEITEALERASGVPMSHRKVPFWLALQFTYVATALAVLTRRPPIFTPNSLRILQTWPRFDFEKSRSELGYSPRPIAESLADAVAWVQGRLAEVKEGTE